MMMLKYLRHAISRCARLKCRDTEYSQWSFRNMIEYHHVILSKAAFSKSARDDFRPPTESPYFIFIYTALRESRRVSDTLTAADD